MTLGACIDAAMYQRVLTKYGDGKDPNTIKDSSAAYSEFMCGYCCCSIPIGAGIGIPEAW